MEATTVKTRCPFTAFECSAKESPAVDSRMEFAMILQTQRAKENMIEMNVQERVREMGI